MLSSQFETVMNYLYVPSLFPLPPSLPFFFLERNLKNILKEESEHKLESLHMTFVVRLHCVITRAMHVMQAIQYPITSDIKTCCKLQLARV